MSGPADTKRFKIYTRTGDSGTSSLYTGQRLPKDCGFFEALGDVDELACAIGLAREFVLGTSDKLADQLAEIQSRLLDVGSAVATPSTASSGAKVQRTRFDPAHSTTVEGWLDDLDADLPPLRNFILPSGGKAAAALHVARAVCRRAERSVVALARSTTAGADARNNAPKPAPPQAEAAALSLGADSSSAEAGKGGEQGGKGAEEEEEGARVEGGADVAAAAVAGVPEDSVVDPTVIVYVNRLSDYLFTAARFMAQAEGRPEVTYKKGA